MFKPTVIDLSHHYWDNGGAPNFQAAAAAGLRGVIYKASQGTGYRDPTYNKTRALVEAAGLLWGAYHFGTAATAKEQASNFLNAAAVNAQTLICLDFEKNEQTPSNTITKAIAVEFMDRVSQVVGRMPKFYTGPFMYEVFGKARVSEFQTYDVWWARYAEATELHPTWNNYFLWQYSDGHSGPKPRGVSGIGYCDCNRFDGTDAELSSRWGQ